jgi:hypothetical protein
MTADSPLKLRKYLKSGARRSIRKEIRDARFPMTFFLRNLSRLKLENGWSHRPLRIQGADALRLLSERCEILSKVRVHMRKWGPLNGEKPEDIVKMPAGYCDHCGFCCEIASGFPDFPAESRLPQSWRKIFGDGLGRGHRFCAFLWEVKRSGKSLCSVHPWRSRPCRVFEAEECDYLKEDPGFIPSAQRGRLVKTLRRLMRLLNGRQLPVR